MLFVHFNVIENIIS